MPNHTHDSTAPGVPLDDPSESSLDSACRPRGMREVRLTGFPVITQAERNRLRYAAWLSSTRGGA